MIIYDISKEIFSAPVFPGDTKPSYKQQLSIKNGDICNLTDINMCLHNGTHIDAPSHFINNGLTIEQIDLYKCFGKAYVHSFTGEIDYECLKKILSKDIKRLLIKGNGYITEKAAAALTEHGIILLGTQNQTVGSSDNLNNVHTILLKNEIVILEGLELHNVPEGEYFLSALPIKLGTLDGAPCRAILVSDLNNEKKQAK